MGNKLNVTVPEKGDAFSRIMRFMTKADITLNVQEEVILDRWVYCDVLMRQGIKGHDEIVEDLKVKFNVSKYTAERDISCTQSLFARSRQVVKKYLAHIHEENARQDLQRVRQQLFYKIGKDGQLVERKLDATEIMALAKMNDSYTKALMSLPEEEMADILPPPKFFFQLAPDQKIELALTYDDAIKEADAIIDMEENESGVFEIKNDDDADQ